MLFPENYELWMMLSQWGWLLGFAILSVLYWKILTLPSPVPDTGIR